MCSTHAGREGVCDHTRAQAVRVLYRPCRGSRATILRPAVVAGQPMNEPVNEVCCISHLKIVYGIKPAVCDKLISRMISCGGSYLWKSYCGDRGELV